MIAQRAAQRLPFRASPLQSQPNSLSSAPSESSPYKSIIVVAVVSVLALLVYSSQSRHPSSGAADPNDEPCNLWPVAKREELLGSDSAMLSLTAMVRELYYFPTLDLVLHVVPKGGTTAQLLWIYRGLTGQLDLKDWDQQKCKTYIQDLSSPCWDSLVTFVFQLPTEQQRQVLTRDSTLRIAVQRDPYDRLVSAFKSKFTCERARFFGDVDMVVNATYLREQAGDASGGNKCMDIDEYAEILDRCRLNVGKPGYLRKLHDMDGHIRPTRLFFDRVEYDLILNSDSLKDPAIMRSIYERLPFKDQLEPAVPSVHTSGTSQLDVPAEARRKLEAFAALTEVKPTKVCFKQPIHPGKSIRV